MCFQHEQHSCCYHLKTDVHFFSVEYNSNVDSESITVTEIIKDILKNEANPFILPKPEDSQFVTLETKFV